MSPQQPSGISVIDPISPAIQRVKVMLFKPFELRKWFVIGFCAWLAYLGKGGGGGGGPHYNIFHKPHEQQNQIAESINAAKEYTLDNLYWIIPTVVIVAVVIIAIALLITWLSSRGKFMFLHCVAQNKAEVKIPWAKFKQHANSLFLFRIVLGLIAFAATVIPSAIFIFLIAMPMFHAGPGRTLFWLTCMIFLPVFFVLLLAFLLVYKFTTDFVVPIMFLRTASCVTGWREFLTILSVNKARFALYILFQIVIAIAIGTIVVIGFCIGLCLCCASLLLFIPYIGTVILLPLLIFKRAYSLYYLRQFGPRFDVFSS